MKPKLLKVWAFFIHQGKFQRDEILVEKKSCVCKRAPSERNICRSDGAFVVGLLFL